MIGYLELKALANELGCRATDLIALAPKNDPFYAGVPAREAGGQWFADLYNRLMSGGTRLHLRRAHYVLVSQESPILKPDGEPYENTDGCWNFLCGASLAARYLKLVPTDAIVDRRNPDPHIYAAMGGNRARTWSLSVTGSPPRLSEMMPETRMPDYCLAGFDAYQSHHVEVFVEKSTMNDILEPLAERLGFNLVP